MNLKKPSVLIVCLVIALVLSSGCILPGFNGTGTGDQTTREFHETYTLDAGARVSVDNINGGVSVETWDKDYADVYALLSTSIGESELDKVEIQVSNNGEFTVTTVHDGINVQVSVSYTIMVPEGVTIDEIGSSNGGVELDGTTGDTQIWTSNGGVDINDLEGDVTVQTSNGDVSVKYLDGLLDVTTSNGNIYVEGVTGIVGLSTSNGVIDAEVSSITDDLEIATSNGRVRIYLAPDLDANVDIHTSNGGITLHDAIITTSQVSSTRVTGTLGSGGYNLEISTSNGNIEVYEL